MPAKEPGVVKRGLAVSQSGLCLGGSGSARIPACCSRHLAANVRQCMTSHPPDVEALMAEGRKRMLSASPPDHPLRRHPTLTRLGLVQRWAVLEIPAGDQLRTEMGTSRWFLGGHPKTHADGPFSSRRQLHRRWVVGDQIPVGGGIGGSPSACLRPHQPYAFPPLPKDCQHRP